MAENFLTTDATDASEIHSGELRVEERDLSAAHVDLTFWKPYDESLRQGGFGFVQARRGDDAPTERVMVHSTAVYPPLPRGQNPPSSKGLVLLPEDIEWDAKKGPRAVRIFSSEDAYHDWERTKALEREREAQLIRDREYYAQQERARKDEARERWAPILEKLKLIRELQTFEYHAFVPHQLRDAMTAEVTPDDVLMLHSHTTWGNDGPSDDGFGHRAGARSYSVFQSDSDYLVLKETRPVDDPDKIGGYDANTPGYAKVRVRGNIAPYTFLGAEQVGDTVSSDKRSTSDTTYRFFKPNPSDKSYISEYAVPVEDAAQVWEHAKWWNLYPEDFAVAYAAAQQIKAARLKWEEEFPGIAPGDLTGIRLKFKLQGYDPTDLFPSESIMDMDWLKHVYWYVPEVFDKPEGEILKERRAKLVELYNAGDERARALLEYESRELLRADIWDTVASTVGHPLHSETRRSEEFWDTVRFEPADRDNVPNYRGYVVGPDGVKSTVARLEVWQNVPTAKPYYRVKVSPESLNVPQVYSPGDLKWEEDLPPTPDETRAERQAEYDRLFKLASRGDTIALTKLESNARDWLLDDLWFGLADVTGAKIEGSYIWESDFIFDHGDTVPVFTAFVVDEHGEPVIEEGAPVEVAQADVWYGRRNYQPYYRVDSDKIVYNPKLYRPGSVKWIHTSDAPGTR